MMLRSRVFDSILDVAPELWDATGSDPLSTHGVLRALEEAGIPGLRIRYAVVESQGGFLEACAPLAILDVDARHLTQGVLRRGFEAIHPVAPSVAKTRIALCGTPLSVGNPPVRMAAGADPAAACSCLAEILEGWADEEDVPWRVFKEFDAAGLPQARALAARGWILAPSEPGFRLSLRWDGYPEYLRSMRHPYRRRIRRSQKRFRSVEFLEELLPLRSGYDDGMHPLYDAVWERAQVRLERLTPRFFRGLGEYEGSRAQMLRFSREGQVVGWVALLRAGDTLVDLFHGTDHGVNRSADLYFNEIAGVIRAALGQGVKSVVLGQSSEEAKIRFGATAAPLWFALRHRNPVVHRGLRRGRNLLFPDRDLPRRRVFRELDGEATP